MSQVEFVKDTDGKFRRIWLERKVVDTSPLLSLQLEVARAVSVESLVRESRLHLTWFHLGRPEDLESEVLEANPNLDRRSFSEALQSLVIDIGATKGKPVTTRGEGLDIFGDATKSLLVLKLQKNSQLMKGRDLVVSRMFTFLAECGIASPEDFMLGNPNLKYQLDDQYNPHITLASLTPSVSIARSRDVTDIQIQFAAPVLTNVVIT